MLDLWQENFTNLANFPQNIFTPNFLFIHISLPRDCLVSIAYQKKSAYLVFRMMPHFIAFVVWEPRFFFLLKAIVSGNKMKNIFVWK